MYNYIKGRFVGAEDNLIVVESGGIGYELTASYNSIQKLGAMGDDCTVYCYLSVREDEMSLYGFADKAEKDLFLKLTQVSGIGCKMAISILNYGSLSDIVTAIASADVSKLSKIKGIGKKTAERIVVELRDKIAPGTAAELNLSPAINIVNEINGEAVQALLSLGFTSQEAKSAVAKAEKPGMTTEEVVLAALRGMV